MEAAARTYFGASVQELTLSQAALLAALPRAPGNYSPFEHPDVARTRRAYVLKRMVELEYVKPEEATRATAAPLGLVAPERRRGSGQYFLEYIQQRLEAKLGSDLVYKGGLSVYTTLNPVMQRTAEQALREGLQALAARQASKVAGKGGAAPPVPEGAIILIEPQTGYIKALVGGTDFARSEFNRAVNARRQPGSAFKPFVYLAALEAGRTPAELLDDSPLTYTFNGRTWSPENYDNKFRGHITLQQSLEESVNVPTVRLAESIGIGRVVDAARRLGIQSPLQANLALALGAADVSLLELTAAYAALANQGARMEPVSIRYITDGQGRLIDENIPQGKDAVNPATAYVLTADAAGRGRAGHRGQREDAGPPDRREDGHHQRLLERLVRGLHADAGRGRVGRSRSGALARSGRDRSQGGPPDLDRPHARGVEGPPG